MIVCVLGYVLPAIAVFVVSDFVALFLGIGAALTCTAYVISVFLPMLYSKGSMWLGAGWLLLPVPLLIAAAILLPQKLLLFWLCAIGTMGVGGILPLVRFLLFRLRILRMFGVCGKSAFSSCITAGRRTPTCVTRITTEGEITLAVLGDIGAVRYYFDENAVVSQRVRALSADILHELERKDDTAFHRALLSPLTGEKKRMPHPMPSEDKPAYLIVHPHCIPYAGDTPAEYGARVGGYTWISPKTLENLLRRTQIKE